jgi:hypothetical protein
MDESCVKVKTWTGMWLWLVLDSLVRRHLALFCINDTFWVTLEHDSFRLAFFFLGSGILGQVLIFLRFGRWFRAVRTHLVKISRPGAVAQRCTRAKWAVMPLYGFGFLLRGCYGSGDKLTLDASRSDGRCIRRMVWRGGMIFGSSFMPLLGRLCTV